MSNRRRVHFFDICISVSLISAVLYVALVVITGGVHP